jgi:hypothetical protein
MILLFAVVTGPLLAFNMVLATRTATYRLRRPRRDRRTGHSGPRPQAEAGNENTTPS